MRTQAQAGEIRSRSGAEVAFMIMRVLATARVLWARSSAVPMDALCALVPVAAADVALAVDRLCDEGIAERVADGTIRLTELAARDGCVAGDGWMPAAVGRI